MKFINGFKDNKVDEILNPKVEKGKTTKDIVRTIVLNEQFNQFIGRENIDLD